MEESQNRCSWCGHWCGKLAMVLVFLAIALYAGKVAYYNYYHPSFPQPAMDGWQAVFLTNDQVYFGKLTSYSREYAVLEQIFYLRAADPLQQGTTGPALNLVKLGGELHGPSDKMYLPKDRIMFWENLRADSQVVTAITGFLAQ